MRMLDPLKIQSDPGQTFRVVVERELGQLEKRIQDWESLAAAAIEPNPWYEHWMLMPALREFAEKDVFVVTVYGESDGLLSGIFPMVRRSFYRRLPIANFSFWKHKYCFLCTPLLRGGAALGALDAFLDWTEKQSPAWSLMEFNHTTGEGPFADTLLEALESHRTGEYHEYQIATSQRALIRPALSSQLYLETNLSSGRRKEWRRQFNRLRDLGPTEFVELEREEDIDTWIKQFMELEASGWKGRAGSAILQDEPSQRFFSAIVHEAFRRGRLMLLMLRLNDEPIAMKCNILADPGAFAFKIAYKEEFSRFSPGLQLELEMIRRIHENHSIHWMDSCAEPNHTMIDHLWAERRKVQTVIVPAPNPLSAPILSLIDMRNRYAQKLWELREKVKRVA